MTNGACNPCFLKGFNFIGINVMKVMTLKTFSIDQFIIDEVVTVVLQPHQ